MSFTFDDFLEQMGQVREMGPLDDLMAMIPGSNKMKGLKNAQLDESQLTEVEAIIQSMTKKSVRSRVLSMEAGENGLQKVRELLLQRSTA